MSRLICVAICLPKDQERLMFGGGGGGFAYSHLGRQNHCESIKSVLPKSTTQWTSQHLNLKSYMSVLQEQ